MANEAPYTTIANIQADAGSAGRITVGRRGTCRFCRGNGPFRKIAHTIPEALGNKWLVSLDECDRCNAGFSANESAIVSALAPFLTVGGVRGKKNKGARQVGLSSGSAILRHTGEAGSRRISAIFCGDGAGLNIVDPFSDTPRLRIPLAATPFQPVSAYKALAKIGYSLLPDSELPHFEALRRWLVACEGPPILPLLVHASFAFVGNSAPILQAVLFRRQNPRALIPHIILLLCVGSICIQMDLKGSDLDLHLTDPTRLNFRYSATLATSETEALRFEYGNAVSWDWSSTTKQPQPVAAFEVIVNATTREATIVPIFRHDKE